MFQILHSPGKCRAHTPIQLRLEHKIAVTDIINLRGVAQVFRYKNDPAAGTEAGDFFRQGDSVHPLHTHVQYHQIRTESLLCSFHKRQGSGKERQLGIRKGGCCGGMGDNASIALPPHSLLDPYKYGSTGA